MNGFLYGSICLTDIPQQLVTIGKNGKKYLNIAVAKRKEKGKFGETHTITATIPKDQRQPNAPTLYIGNLKTWEGSTNNNTTSIADDDLPF